VSSCSISSDNKPHSFWITSTTHCAK